MGGTTHDQLYDAFGAYVRSQRQLARLTLRQAAELASISNPYLSQIEHGLVLPSIAVLSALARALSVSAETMLLRAAGISLTHTAEHPRQTEDSIRQDPRLDNSQKLALLAVLSSFVGSSSGRSASDAVPSDAVLSDAVSLGALPSGALPLDALPSDALSPDAVTSEAASSGAEPDDSAPVVARRGISTSTSAGPAAAGQAGPRRKGV